MGFFSKLLGKNEEDEEVKRIVNKLLLFLNDEKVQMEYMGPELKEMLLTCPAYDRDPNGSGPFGFIESNPIPVNGQLGELSYLSRLETTRGERIVFHRIGSIENIDAFECVTFSGSEWFIFFLDMYHPRRSRATPDSFHFTQAVPQFSGYTKYCKNFPYDFVEMKKNASLSECYMPIKYVTPYIEKGAYQRSIGHKNNLDTVKKRLTSVLT